MKSLPFQTLLILVLLFIPFNGVLALDARVETIDGEVLAIKDFSMEGRQHFYVDWKGGTSTLDWKDISSFEIMRIGQNFWVEVLLPNGKKDSFQVRQLFSFKGRSDFGQWSIPFEKIKKVFLLRDAGEGEKKEELSVKETDGVFNSMPKEVDKIILRNGDVLIGNLLNEIVSIKTSYGTLSFKKEDILRVSFGTPGKIQKERELDSLYSKYGDKLTGNISESQVKITLLTKTTLSLSREHIKEIEFGVMVGNEPKIPQEKLNESVSPNTQ